LNEKQIGEETQHCVEKRERRKNGRVEKERGNKREQPSQREDEMEETRERKRDG
jgi:hypothetical protein